MRIHCFQFLPCLPQPSPHWTQGRTSLASLEKNITRSNSHGQGGQGQFSRCTEAEKKRIQSQSNKEMGFYLRRRGKPTHLWRPEIRVFCAESRGVEDDHCAHFMVIHLVKDVMVNGHTPGQGCLHSTHHQEVSLLTIDQKFWSVLPKGHSVTMRSFAWYGVFLCSVYILEPTCVWPSTKTAFM